MAADIFQCTVVTPEGPVLDVEALSAVFPAYDGYVGILPNHAPLLTKVGIGVLRVREDGGEGREIYVDGGFAQMAGNHLTILSEKAKPVADLSSEATDALWKEARRFGQVVSEQEVEARDRAYERARVWQRLAPED